MASTPLVLILLAAAGIELGPILVTVLGIALFLAPLATGLTVREIKRHKRAPARGSETGQGRDSRREGSHPGVTLAMAFGCLMLAPLLRLLLGCLHVELHPLLAVALAIGLLLMLLVVRQVRRSKRGSKAPLDGNGEAGKSPDERGERVPS